LIGFIVFDFFYLFANILREWVEMRETLAFVVDVLDLLP